MSTGHILVVDDEPSMLRYLQTVLELDSYRVSTASNGIEAVEKVQRDGPDLVLLDMVMPGADGLETLQRIRETRPSTKVVMLSCVRDTRKVAQAMRLGAQDYLSKPVQKEEMDEVLRFCLENTEPGGPGAGEAIEVSEGVYFFSATAQMRQLRSQAMQVAKFDFPVLILGESGTGKEVLAQLIHKYSDRAHRTFLKVNCAAVPSELLESELFGYEPGAFTDARSQKKGRFELAHGGTLFLDEVGELSQATQVKLLRVLQEREFERLGGVQPIKVNVRLIAATNKDLETAMQSGTFREDLYYRLNVFSIFMPPLRDRKPDILLLADHFVEKYAGVSEKSVRRISTPAIDMLMSYHWPGNVRELENCIERAVLVCGGGVVHAHDLPPTLQTAEVSGTLPRLSLDQAVGTYEKDLIVDSLKTARGNRAHAARLLDTTERIIGYKIKKYAIDCTRFKSSGRVSREDLPAAATS
jgi:DNA-binding NtrC family response regulator